jgi:hypothetical protein
MHLSKNQETGQKKCQKWPSTSLTMYKYNVLVVSIKKPVVAYSKEVLNKREGQNWAAFIVTGVFDCGYFKFTYSISKLTSFIAFSKIKSEKGRLGKFFM